MTPAIWASEIDKEIKKSLFQELAMTGHWPSSHISKTNWHKKTKNCVTRAPDNACTKEALELVGLSDYDFNDGEPNGPPAPIFKLKK